MLRMVSGGLGMANLGGRFTPRLSMSSAGTRGKHHKDCAYTRASVV